VAAEPGGVAVGAPGSKGLKANAIGFLSSTVIGVASTAPAYSLAVSLGLVAAAVGFFSPAIMIVAFIPMLCIAVAYYYMNRADPDCGTSFAWVSRAMGPVPGWLTGWAIIVADIVVMASLAEVAAVYTFALFGIDTSSWGSIGIAGVEISIASLATVSLGIAFIVVLTWIVYVGIEVSARTQVALLTIELLALGAFAVVALARVATGGFADGVMPTLEWLNPLAITDADGNFDWSALTAGVIVAIFIYWGWDTAATVNEETTNTTETPGRAAIISTLILVGTYVLVSIAAQAVHGAAFLAEQGEEDVLGALAGEVLGSPLDKLLIIAILTSAAASTQTTILPTARTALSMGAKRALPAYWARTHERYLTPTSATIWMGILSIVWYVGIKIASENLFLDAVWAMGLMIAFYYGLTGFACTVYYRHRLLHSIKALFLMGVVPLAGGLMLTAAFVKSVMDLGDPEQSYSGVDWFGLGPPLVITGVFAIVGVVLMLAQWRYMPEFFHGRPEAAAPEPATPEDTPKPTFTAAPRAR
jgi:amino acid transporter